MSVPSNTSSSGNSGVHGTVSGSAVAGATFQVLTSFGSGLSLLGAKVITHTTGTYQVFIPVPTFDGFASNMIASSLGAANCHVTDWAAGSLSNGTSGTNFTVQCFTRQGVAVDSSFSFVLASDRPGAPSKCSVLQQGDGLLAGDSLLSCDGRFVLAMQTDGNLVLYQNGVGPIWATATNGIPNQPHVAILGTDGNLMLNGPQGSA
jgi:hypothetical protein